MAKVFESEVDGKNGKLLAETVSLVHIEMYRETGTNASHYTRQI